MPRAAKTLVTDRWSRANDRLFTVLAPAAANRWWVTPMEKLSGLSPIEVWEAGGKRAVEDLIADYEHCYFT